MKTRDLFAGYAVTIATHDEVWLVSLTKHDQRPITLRRYQQLPDALDAAHEWLLMLSDETEIIPGAVAAHSELREVLARAALGEEVTLSDTIDETQTRDEMGTWFAREMNKSRREEE
jgi:hypothetical protein